MKTILFPTILVLCFTPGNALSFHYGTDDPDLYAVLGIYRDDPRRIIKQKYRKMALLLHPDKNRCDEEAANKFVLLQKAYETIDNRMKRIEYNLKNSKAGRSGQKFEWFLPEVCNDDVLTKQEKENWYDVDIPVTFFDDLERWIESKFSPEYITELLLRILIPLKPYLLSTIKWNWDLMYLGGILFSSSSSLSSKRIYHFIVTFILCFVFSPLIFAVYSISAALMKICVHTFIAVGILGYALQTEVLQTTLQSLQEKYFTFLFVILYQYHVILVCYSILTLFIVIYFQYRYKTHKINFYVNLYNILTRLVGLYVIYMSVHTQNEAFVVISFTLFCNFFLVPCVKSVFYLIKLLLTSIYHVISRKLLNTWYFITFNLKRLYTQ